MKTYDFCVDYPKLYTVTMRDSYPKPRVDYCIDFLGKAASFYPLAARSRYWRDGTVGTDRDKTTSSSHYGLHRLIRMPFGLQNVSDTF